MKLLHTADWHLGRYLHGRSLIEDQAHVLDQLVALARERAVDAVLVAGDIFDRSVPPADAVALLDEVLSRLVVDCGIPVVMIAGNHDSAERIGFGGRVSERQGLVLRGSLDRLEPLVLADAHGEVAIHPLPYADPVMVRALPGYDHAGDHQQAMAGLLDELRRGFVAGRRNVLVAHAFVAGGAESESERPLSVGGSGQVAADSFVGFDYVALGHLHRPQSIAGGRIHYAGSLLKYSFNEAAHDKSVSLVDIAADGAVTIEHVALAPLRDLGVLRGGFAELLASAAEAAAREHYLRAELTDTVPLLDPMARLREVYPNLLELQFVALDAGGEVPSGGRDHRQRAPAELFAAFYHELIGEAPDDARMAAFEAVVATLMRRDREDAA
ncbi:MAG: exonuclease SbcCD subunit D [Zoogloeaceae bacterium]|nr:exonuclease SbcCD subunit D [Rhodocyclaceae bacterium]MCP5237830.1 exonuclease SbcCD subunit D [Zoogloeaceae bacterium]